MMDSQVGEQSSLLSGWDRAKRGGLPLHKYKVQNTLLQVIFFMKLSYQKLETLFSLHQQMTEILFFGCCL